jgi:hypothetical protein
MVNEHNVTLTGCMGMGKQWQLRHNANPYAHTDKSFYWLAPSAALLRLVCNSTCLLHVAYTQACVHACKIVKSVQCENMQLFQTWQTAAQMHEVLVTAYRNDAVTKKDSFKVFSDIVRGK